VSAGDDPEKAARPTGADGRLAAPDHGPCANRRALARRLTAGGER